MAKERKQEGAEATEARIAEVRKEQIKGLPPGVTEADIDEACCAVADAELKAANEALHFARAGFQAAKEVCKERRGELDAAQNRVNGLVDQLTGHEAPEMPEMPLFENGKDAGDKSEIGDRKSEIDEDWRSVELSSFRGEMSLPKALLLKLAVANIATVGGLADWTTEDRTLTMIEGIGEAGAAKIELALKRFWERRKAAAEAS